MLWFTIVLIASIMAYSVFGPVVAGFVALIAFSICSLSGIVTVKPIQKQNSISNSKDLYNPFRNDQ